MHQLPNNFVLVLNQYRNREINRYVLLSLYTILIDRYSKLNQNIIRAWKSRAQHLNTRDPYVHIEMNDEVNSVAEPDTQLQILTLS